MEEENKNQNSNITQSDTVKDDNNSVNFYNLYNKDKDNNSVNKDIRQESSSSQPTEQQDGVQKILQDKIKSGLEEALILHKKEEVKIPQKLNTEDFPQVQSSVSKPKESQENIVHKNLKDSIQNAILEKPINLENNNPSANGEKEAEESILKSLRTYKDDLAQAMVEKKSSIVSIASAENERRISGMGLIQKQEFEHNNYFKKVSLIVLSVVFVVVGAGSAFYFYGKSQVETVEPKAKIESIIFADSNEEFEINGLSRRQILNELKVINDKSQIPLGRIKNIFITGSFIDDDDLQKKFLVSAKDFLNVIETDAKSSFLRSLNPTFMLGVHSFDGNQPFMIFQTNFYENAFAGMLEWERYMKDDLAPLFGPAENTIPTNNISTSTVKTEMLVFNDTIIKNQDTRFLKDRDGNTVLLYSFVDKNTIIITTNEHTLEEVLVRYKSIKSR